jgi:hypothetical protein
LLELEQKFESYCTINEEELKQIKMALEQLREDILSVNENCITNNDRNHMIVDSLSDSSRNSGENDQR